MRCQDCGCELDEEDSDFIEGREIAFCEKCYGKMEVV